MCEGGWEAVGVNTPTESSHADLTEACFPTTATGDLGFEDHTDGNTLAVEEVGCEEGFDGMTDGMTQVY